MNLQFSCAGHSWALPRLLLTHLLFQQPCEGKMRYSLPWLYCFSLMFCPKVSLTPPGDSGRNFCLHSYIAWKCEGLSTLTQAALIPRTGEGMPLSSVTLSDNSWEHYASFFRGSWWKQSEVAHCIDPLKIHSILTFLLWWCLLLSILWFPGITSQVKSLHAACVPGTAFQRDGHRKRHDSHYLWKSPFSHCWHVATLSHT